MRDAKPPGSDETRNRGISQSRNYSKDDNRYNWFYDGPSKCRYVPQHHDLIVTNAGPEFIKGFSSVNRGINHRV
jgi:hypothetical protein